MITKYIDDHGKTCDELRLLPYSDGGNILVGRSSYEVEMKSRKERIKAGVPFDLPKWEELKVYSNE